MTNNWKQLDNARLLRLCEELGIRKHFSMPNHPQANDRVEAINEIIKHTLKVKLEALRWADKLPSVL